MTENLVCFLLLWSFGPLAACAFVGLMSRSSHQRIYKYAVMMAGRFDVDDLRGQAYSDMATVIALDGKAEPKQWADMRAGVSDDE